MKVISRHQNPNDDEYKVFPTIITGGEIHVVLPDRKDPLIANVRIFDLKGTLHFQSMITGSKTINCDLPVGTYFVSLQTDDFHKVEKIMIQN